MDLSVKSDYGVRGSTANSFNEILALFNEGKCGKWVEATIGSRAWRQTSFGPRPAAGLAPWGRARPATE